jgi:hypothetical protein
LNTAVLVSYNDRKGGIPVKKLLCLVLLILCFAVPACAESVIPADDDDVRIMLEEALEKMEFDYSSVTLNREKGIFVVDIALDGMAMGLIYLKGQGYDESLESWVNIKDVMLSTHADILNWFKAIHRDDLKLILNVVNDDAYIRNDYTTISFNPLLTIGTYGMVTVDAMK